MMCPVFQATSMNMIKTKDITLGEVEERKVGEQLEYVAKIYRTDGRKVVINTPFFHLKNLTFENLGKSNIKIVHVPMTQWLRDQVRQIEQAVESQVELPEDLEHLGLIMKHMYCNADMANIVTSKFLKFLSCNESGNIIADIDEDVDVETLGDTEFSFKIEFPHVYMGNHKNGQTVSCSARVTSIRFKSDLEFDEEATQSKTELKTEAKITPEEKVKLSKSKSKVKRLASAK